MNWRDRFTLKDVYKDFDNYTDEVKEIILANFETAMDKYYEE
jgi:hypothetical protein|tara:strand:+ start:826 stop:951 length:126 start_codon:yes stop_codon:yes gene_type:complete